MLRLRVTAGVVGAADDGLSDRCRRALRVAVHVGAPVLEAIDGAAAAEDDQRRAARAVQVASAQTKMVAVGLLAAPLLLVPGLGRLVGTDLLGFYGSGVGMIVLAAGVLLLATGAGVIAWLVRRVGRPASARRSGGLPAAFVAIGAGWLAWRLVGPALAPISALLAHHLVASRGQSAASMLEGLDEAADLAATALAGGVGVPHALRLAAEQLPWLSEPLQQLAFDLELGLAASDDLAATAGANRLGFPTGTKGGASVHAPGDAGLQRMRAVLVTAADVGAASAPTLRRLASDLRADDLARVLAAAERLPAQLTFPTALCLLPATVLLIGAPIVHAGLAAAGT